MTSRMGIKEKLGTTDFYSHLRRQTLGMTPGIKSKTICITPTWGLQANLKLLDYSLPALIEKKTESVLVWCCSGINKPHFSQDLWAWGAIWLRGKGGPTTEETLVCLKQADCFHCLQGVMTWRITTYIRFPTRKGFKPICPYTQGRHGSFASNALLCMTQTNFSRHTKESDGFSPGTIT